MDRSYERPLAGQQEQVTHLHGAAWRAELVFLAFIGALMASPLWGPILALPLHFPRWGGFDLALAPVAALGLAGAINGAVARWTRLLPATSTRIELAAMAAFLALTLALPLAGHYAGWW